MARIPVPDQDKIDFEKPTFTLDVNLIPLKSPESWPPGLPHLEWNYFETQQMELCVTPQTPNEIVQGVPIEELGSTAYKRFQKSEFYKKRPLDTVLDFADQEANEVWLDLRRTLFSSVTDDLLTPNQQADVTQAFYHLTVSGTLSNSAFISTDHVFTGHSAELQRRFGITVMNPVGAWGVYGPSYGLVTPSDDQVRRLWEEQHNFIAKLKEDAQR